jgi:hypothetical protein
MGFNIRVWVSDGSSIMSNDIWYFIWSNFSLLDSAEFEFSLFVSYWLYNESSLDVIEDSEVFSGLFN